MSDLSHTVLRFVIMTLAIFWCGVIALIVLDCLSRIAFGQGIMS